MKHAKPTIVLLIAVIVMAVACTSGSLDSSRTSPTSPGSSTSNAPTTDISSPENAAQESAGTEGEPSYEAGYVLVTLLEGETPEEAIAKIAATPNLEDVTLDSQVTDRIVKLALPPELSVGEAIELIEKSGAIEAAQPNYRYTLQGHASASEAALIAQAGRSTTGLLAGTALGNALGIQMDTPSDQHYGKQWYLNSVKAPDAWRAVKASSSPTPVSIAVMDADFQYNHPDLEGNIADTFYADMEHTSASDMNHGTHTAGTVAAVADNGIGVAGITYNLCRVVPMRVSDPDEEIYTEYLADAYEWLLKYGSAKRLNVRVVSMSLGAGTNKAVSRSTDPALYDAISKARRAGIVTVVAACNTDSYHKKAPFYAFPADFDNVVSVINVGQLAKSSDGVLRDSASNYNKGSQKTKNVSAPGEGIYNLTRNGYGYMSGTSMATPVVAGVFGLMFTANPELSADQAISKLYSTARDLKAAKGTSKGWDKQTGFGEVDAAAAVKSSAAYLSGSNIIKKTGSLKVMVNDTVQNATSWRWSSSNPEIARVSATGLVRGCKKGWAIITAKKGSLSASQVVHVTKAASGNVQVKMSKLDVRVARKTYSGKKCTPVPVVYDGGTKLTKGTHYTVKYSNNLNAGKAKASVKGKSLYTGSVTKRFTIEKAPIENAHVERSPSGSHVKLYDIGRNSKRTLKRGADYKVKMLGHSFMKVTATAKCKNFTGSCIIRLY